MRERRKRLKVVVVMITDHSVNLVKMIEEARVHKLSQRVLGAKFANGEEKEG